MKILFIGGTGIISSACTALAVEKGYDVHLLRRGRTERPIPEAVTELRADIREPTQAKQALKGQQFDAVVDFVAFTPAHVEIDIELFKGQTRQFVFISSASVYQTPPSSLPIVESTPLSNPFWQYSRDKIACERRLMDAYVALGFPVTIVRPSHTYDRTLLPFEGGYTVVDRMRRNQPVVVQGDGTSLWVLTHHADFAKGLIGLLGHPGALGQSVHITSDEWLSWNQIYEIVAEAAGVEPKLVHVPSRRIAELDPDWGASLLGDKTHSMVFDNTKIKRLVPGFLAEVPFFRGAKEIVDYYDQNPSRRRLDQGIDAIMDRLVSESHGRAE